jgi:hypothetical protein
MKRILTTLIALVIFAGIADAQISIKKSDVGKPKQMTTLSMSWSWIYQADESYFLVMKSDNQFDDHYWLKIGDTREECLESLSALQEMMDNMGETERYNVDNGMGESFSVTLSRELGIKKLTFNGESYAGAGFLLASNLSKATKWIEKNVK